MSIGYGSLLRRYNVTELQLLKVDTEGFDVAILRQMLEWGKENEEFPERLQFELNNLTEENQSQELLEELKGLYNCWFLEDDVHCQRLGAVKGTWAGEEGWWRLTLPSRLPVAFVRSVSEVTVGDAPQVADNRLCESRDGWAQCGWEGRYVGLLNSKWPDLEVLVPRTRQGAFRVSTGRVCCHRGCSSDTHLFEGYEPQCEQRCRSDPECAFFTIFNSMWCITSADCDEELLTLAASSTFGIAPEELAPIQLTQAEQSSSDWGGAAQRAIDGISDAHFMRGSCSHTAEDSRQIFRF